MPCRKQWRDSWDVWGEVILSLLKICQNESHFDIVVSWKSGHSSHFTTWWQRYQPCIPLHSLLPETGEGNSGLFAFLYQLPSRDTPAGDLLQLESQRAFGALRTFRFPFPEGNWLACCPWKLPLSLLTTSSETAPLLPQQRKHTRQVNGAVRHVQESWK